MTTMTTATVDCRPYGMVEFRAMASPCRIVADEPGQAAAGERLVHELEQRWSRFLPTSEVSRVNAAGGSWCVVTPHTLRLFQAAEFARTATRGRFNPFVLDRLERAEHGENLDCGAVHDAAIEFLPAASAVRLPAGLRFDPGGIGKGLAGDLVVEHLLGFGSSAAQVELGGDVRVAGERWTREPWEVIVVDPRDRSASIGSLRIEAGAVATSSVLGRRWTAGSRVHHHLIDPATGLSSDSDLLSVSATSSELWWAEVAAKSVVLAGRARARGVMGELDVAGVLLDVDGVVTVVERRVGGTR